MYSRHLVFNLSISLYLIRYKLERVYALWTVIVIPLDYGSTTCTVRYGHCSCVLVHLGCVHSVDMFNWLSCWQKSHRVWARDTSQHCSSYLPLWQQSLDSNENDGLCVYWTKTSKRTIKRVTHDRTFTRVHITKPNFSVSVNSKTPNLRVLVSRKNEKLYIRTNNLN